MSLPTQLVQPARSAYREIIRAARSTFHGDPTRRHQFMIPIRQTFASPTFTPPSSVHDPTAKPEPEPCPCAGPPSASASSSTSTSKNLAPKAPLESVSEQDVAKRIAEWREVAVFLRRNLVQGEQDANGSYRLRVTPDTEIGGNDTIRTAERRPKATKEQRAAVFANP